MQRQVLGKGKLTIEEMVTGRAEASREGGGGGGDGGKSGKVAGRRRYLGGRK